MQMLKEAGLSATWICVVNSFEQDIKNDYKRFLQRSRAQSCSTSDVEETSFEMEFSNLVM